MHREGLRAPVDVMETRHHCLGRENLYLLPAVEAIVQHGRRIGAGHRARTRTQNHRHKTPPIFAGAHREVPIISGGEPHSQPSDALLSCQGVVVVLRDVVVAVTRLPGYCSHLRKFHQQRAGKMCHVESGAALPGGWHAVGVDEVGLLQTELCCLPIHQVNKTGSAASHRLSDGDGGIISAIDQ